MHDLVIPETHYGEALGAKPIITPNITRIVGMLKAVTFDDEAMLENKRNRRHKRQWEPAGGT
jgi:hypothetical protein